MRVLFVSWAWPSHLFPMVALAWSMRLDGHEVMLACPPSLVPVAVRTGLPVTPIGRDVDAGSTMTRYLSRPGPTARRVREDGSRPTPLDMFVPLAEAMVEGLLTLGRQWRPNLIVYEPTSYAAPAVAATLGVPAVRHLWGIDFTYPLRAFEPIAFAGLYGRLGLSDGPVGDQNLTLDPCPPVLQLPVDYEPVRMTYRPYNGTGLSEPDLLTPRGRPRVCVTWGTSSGRFSTGVSIPARIVAALSDLDLEVLVLTSGLDVGLGASLPPHWRVMVMQPLDVVLPVCDLVIHPCGSGTALTTVLAGLPQVCIPLIPDQEVTAAALVAVGAGLRLTAAEAEPSSIRAAVETVLADPGYARAAVGVRDQSLALPRPQLAGWELQRAVGG